MKFIVMVIFAIILFCIITVSTANEYLYTITDKRKDDIAVLTMCADECSSECKNLLMSFGHSFFVIENISDEDISVYNYKIPAGEFATFSWWAVDKHMGIWFNIESNYINLTNRYANIECVGMYLDEQELNKLTDYMESNDRYTPIYNCSKQVTKCWNYIAETNEKIADYAIVTPEKVKQQIMNFDEYYQKKIQLIRKICFFDGEDFISFAMEAD